MPAGLKSYPASEPDPVRTWCEQSGRILDNYRRWLGRELIPRDGSAEDQARRLFDAPFVVLSSGNEADPLLNYGNRTALELWETTWDELRGLPGRLTAEPVERPVREAFLQRVRENGYISDYSGIRISRKGRRFRIAAATIWNLVDADGRFVGQAATFPEWLPEVPVR